MTPDFLACVVVPAFGLLCIALHYAWHKAYFVAQASPFLLLGGTTQEQDIEQAIKELE